MLKFKDSLPYEIFRDTERAAKVDMTQVWKIVDNLDSPIPEIYHAMYDTDGTHLGSTNVEICKRFNLAYAKFGGYVAKTLRFLRHPMQQRKYMHTGILGNVSLKDFSDREILEEIARRLKGEE